VVDHLAPLAELAFLASLLRASSSGQASPAAAAAVDAQNDPSASVAPLLRFFTCSADCAAYAAIALAAALPLVRCLDSGVAALLWADPVLRRIVPSCAQQLQRCAERRLAPSSRLRVGAGPADVPFNDATDSRHHFKSQDAQRLFNNREQARDAFLRLLRSHGDARKRLDGEVKLQLLLASLPKEVAALLSNLLPGNGEWFGGLFALHLARAALEAETDADVVVAVARSNSADPAHLQRLHQRLSQRPASTPGLQPHDTHRSSQRPHHKGPSSAHVVAAPTQQALSNADQVAACFAQPSEAFFFDFLEAGGGARSSEFAAHLEASLLDRVLSQVDAWLLPAREPTTTPAATEPPTPTPKPTVLRSGAAWADGGDECRSSATATGGRKLFGATDGEASIGEASVGEASVGGHVLDTEETVDGLLTLRRIAKFLGLLAFRRHWPLSLAFKSAGQSSEALEAGLADAARLVARQPPKLDAREILARAHAQGSLILVVGALTLHGPSTERVRHLRIHLRRSRHLGTAAVADLCTSAPPSCLF
jgi:hypothetical protein